MSLEINSIDISATCIPLRVRVVRATSSPGQLCHGAGSRFNKLTKPLAIVLTTLASLADSTLRGIDWLATQMGADGASLRAWLERDICAWGKHRPA